MAKQNDSCVECKDKDKLIKRLEARVGVLEKQLKKHKKSTIRAKQRLNILEYQIRDHEEVAKEVDFIAAREEIEGYSEIQQLNDSLTMVFNETEEIIEEDVTVLTDLNGNPRVFRARPKLTDTKIKKLKR